MRRGIVFVISGPSGTGKGTVLAEVLKETEGLNFSVSATNRAPREGETDGVHYHFVTDERFDKMIADGEFLEYVGKFKNRYGTLKKEVLGMIESGKDVVLDIETEGARNVKKALGNDCVSLFVLPPDLKTLKERLVGRKTEAPEAVELRYSESVKELLCADQYDYLIINDVLKDCAEDVKSVIRAERMKTFRNPTLTEEIKNKK